jgi:hypothetical protein
MPPCLLCLRLREMLVAPHSLWQVYYVLCALHVWPCGRTPRFWIYRLECVLFLPVLLLVMVLRTGTPDVWDCTCTWLIYASWQLPPWLFCTNYGRTVCEPIANMKFPRQFQGGCACKQIVSISMYWRLFSANLKTMSFCGGVIECTKSARLHHCRINLQNSACTMYRM